MRIVLLMVIIFIPFVGFSQDLIILRNGEQIKCEITKVDSLSVYYDFLKGERIVASYIDRESIRSYKINARDVVSENVSDSLDYLSGKVIAVDTSKYVKEISNWINLLSYSQRFGSQADGWAVHYYGYNLVNTRKWTIPVVLGIESLEIHDDKFSLSNYQSANLSYMLAGLNPFFTVNDYFFLNFGVNLIIG